MRPSRLDKRQGHTDRGVPACAAIDGLAAPAGEILASFRAFAGRDFGLAGVARSADITVLSVICWGALTRSVFGVFPRESGGVCLLW